MGHVGKCFCRQSINTATEQRTKARLNESERLRRCCLRAVADDATCFCRVPSGWVLWLQPVQGGIRGGNEGGGVEMLIPVGSKRDERQSVPVLRRANMAIRAFLSMFGIVCEGCARNALFRTSDGRGACTFLKIYQMRLLLICCFCCFLLCRRHS